MQERRLLQTIADEVHELHALLPKLNETISAALKLQEEQERRIIKLEAKALDHEDRILALERRATAPSAA